MTSAKMRILAVVTGSLLAAGSANAWVAVRAGVGVAGAAAVGVAAGAVAGAAVASSRTTYYAPAPVYVAPAPAPAPAPAAVVTTLPAGCVASGAYYRCGSVTYQSYFGSNGVYYQQVY
jgi:hypothetical protein